MNLRKINAWLSLITTVLFLDHAIFYSVWMISRGSIPKSAEAAPWVLTGFLVLHAVLSIAMAVQGHKEAERGSYKTYGKLNAKTVLQRISGIAMLVLLGLHIAGAFTHFGPKWLHAAAQPVFFAAALAHIAVSFSKAFITLGIGNAKCIKVLDVIMTLLCGVIFAAGVAGLYVFLTGGMAG